MRSELEASPETRPFGTGEEEQGRDEVIGNGEFRNENKRKIIRRRYRKMRLRRIQKLHLKNH